MYSIFRRLTYEPGMVYNKDGVGSTRLYKILKEKLKESQGTRCSTCGRITNSTPNDNLQMCVEHLKPKGLYPLLKNEWSNIIGCCRQCNLSRARNDKERNPVEVISAIDPTYFNLTDYYFYNDFTGQISVRFTVLDKDRLIHTLKVYEINSESMKEDRRRFYTVLQEQETINKIALALSRKNLDHPIIVFPFIIMTIYIQDLHSTFSKDTVIELYKERS